MVKRICVDCDHCEGRWEIEIGRDDDIGTIAYPALDELHDWMIADGWVVTEDAEDLCPVCKDIKPRRIRAARAKEENDHIGFEREGF